jgi:hypothetical protein
MLRRRKIVGLLSGLLGFFVLLAPGINARADDAATTKPSTRPQPAPLTENVNKAAAWLIKNQLKSGAWGQGDESTQMGAGMETIRATPNVADTCMAVMALYRVGNTPRTGEFKENMRAALNFVCDQIESADDKSLSVTSLAGTRTQMKLGTYIDTFMAAQALAEIKGQMPDEGSAKRVENALAKVIHKIEINQKGNGQWVNVGWATTLAQAQAAKALNVAVQNGANVDEAVRGRAEEYARADFRGQAGNSGTSASEPVFVKAADMTPAASAGPMVIGGSFAGGFSASTHPSADNAGVALYSSGGQIAAMQASANSNNMLKFRLNSIVNSSSTQPAEKLAAQAELKRFADNEADLAAAQKDVLQRMQDKQFVAGFGSNGGEEYLSHLNIGESLFLKGGDDWNTWNKTMTANIERVQNGDGSWSGDHCITGRTFCTAAALMVLTIDRAPAPVEAQAKTASQQ